MSDYDASPQVRLGHSLPHLSAQFGVVKDPSFLSISTDTLGYLLSIARFVGIILALSWVIIFLWYCGVAIRCCLRVTRRVCSCFFWCCFQGCRREIVDEIPASAEIDSELSQRYTTIQRLKKGVKDHNRFRRKLIIFCHLTLFSTVLASAVIFLGDTGLTHAFFSFEGAVNVIVTTFTTLTATASSCLLQASAIIASVSPGGSCASMTSSDEVILESQAAVITSAMSGLASLAAPVVHWGNDATSKLASRSVEKTWSLVCEFCAVAVVCGLFAFGILCKSPLVMRFASFLAGILILATTLLACVMMAGVMFFSDFCMAPAANLIGLFSPGSDMYNNLNFFLTCSGINPFQPQLDVATVAVKTINATVVAEITTYNLPSSCSAPLLGQVSTLFEGIESMGSLVSCDPIAALFDQAVNRGVCLFGTSAVYNIMVVLFTTAALLYLAIASTSVFYHFYLEKEGLPDGDVEQSAWDAELGGGRKSDVDEGSKTHFGSTVQPLSSAPSILSPLRPAEEPQPTRRLQHSSSFTIRTGTGGASSSTEATEGGGRTKGTVTFEL